jgi:indolepyruvate decarboxylase
MKAAMASQDAFTILNVHLDPYDTSPALKRLGERMGKNV